MELDKQSKLASRLRHLLQCLVDISTNNLVHYRECINGKPPLLELTAELWDHQEGGSHSCNCVQLFALSILKRIILTQFHLFCVCSELEDDVEYAFGELRSLCEFAEHCNSRQAKMNCCRRADHARLKNKNHLHFTDLVSVWVSCRSVLITEKILQDLSPNNIIHIAQFEASFVRALLGVCATYTSLLQNPSHVAQKSKMVFVSEEMFSMSGVAQQAKITWLDCLIPGAQSEYLRNIGQQLTASIWKKVATELLAQAQPLVLGGSFVRKLVEQLTQAMEHPDLEHHTTVTKCLWYTLSAIEHQQTLAAWDSGFQMYLATAPIDSRKAFKPMKANTVTRSTSILFSDMLPHLDKLTEKSARTASDSHPKVVVVPEAVSRHVDTLSLSAPVRRALSTSVNLSSSYIIQGLRGALANWNLRSVAQLLFIDGPRTSTALTHTANTLARIVCPQYSFPPLSNLNTIECRSRGAFSVTHDGLVNLKDALESFGVAFHDTWSKQCSEFINTVFPSTKNWRSLGKKQRIHHTKPSSYCDSIIEGLVLPIAEAASGLPEDTQPVFVCLLVSILLNELRKHITSNEKTYTASAGRQLLTDFRHLWHKLTSDELGLVWSQQTSQVLSSLPVIKEMEHGFLILCGTADQPTPSQQNPTPFYSMLPSPNLPIFTELAWHSETDWTQCIA